jgi:hypothetical protein
MRIPTIIPPVLWSLLVGVSMSTGQDRGKPDETRPTAQEDKAQGTAPAFVWHDANALCVEGMGWTETKDPYDRLPARAEAIVPEAVWRHSRHTAGVCVRFITDSKQIAAEWDGGGAMNHMAATGNSGLDLYAKRGGEWVFCGVGRPKPERTTAVLTKRGGEGLTEYLLYLPLYNNVTVLKIGVPPGAKVVAPPPRLARPIVFYGTSITQGGCAARSGMAYPAILGRWFDRPVINLGFSGSGKMEREVAALVAELDAAVFVLDALPNMTLEMVPERLGPFVRILRKAHPDTPILLLEHLLGSPEYGHNVALRTEIRKLEGEGIDGLYMLEGQPLLAGRENGTVDGVHPTDLGFLRIASAMEPMLKALLAGREKQRAGK